MIVLLGSRVGAAASGEVAESTALPAARNGAGWRRHAGAMRGGAADASDSAGIDADLAREHLDPHEPQS